MKNAGSIEDQMQSWSFSTVWGLLWCILKANYLAKRRKEEVHFCDLLLPMEWF